MALLRLPRRGEGAERRGDVAGPHLDLPRRLPAARPRGRAASPRSRRRRSSTTSSSSCASCGSCARPSTTSCSRATRRGSPSRIGGIGEDGRPLVTRTSFRYLQTLYNLGPAPEPNLTVFWSDTLPAGFKDFCAQVSIDTSAVQYESDDLIRDSWGDDAAIACCVSPMRVGKQMQFFGARVNLAKTLLYAINGGRDEITGKQVAPSARPSTGEVLDYDDVMAKFDTMMDWLAQTYVDALNCVHYMHDKYAYERIEMALHDRDGPAHHGVRHRRPVGRRRLAVGHQVRQGAPAAHRRRPRHRVRGRGRLPDLRQRRRPRRRHRGVDRARRSWTRSASTRPTATRCTRSRC